MPAKRRKHRGTRAARDPVKRASLAPGAPAAAVGQPVTAAPAVATPAQRTSRVGPVDSGYAMLFQHQSTVRELKRIALITSCIFGLIVILSFVLPRLT